MVGPSHGYAPRVATPCKVHQCRHFGPRYALSSKVFTVACSSRSISSIASGGSHLVAHRVAAGDFTRSLARRAPSLIERNLAQTTQHHIPVEERRCCGVNAPGAGSGRSRAADASVRHQPGEGRSMGWPRSPIACHMPAQRLLDVVSRCFRSRRRKWPSTIVPARRRRWPQHGGAVGGDCLRDAELGARRQRRVVQWHPRDASS